MSEIVVQGMFKWRARVRDKAYFVAYRAERCAGTRLPGNGQNGRALEAAQYSPILTRSGEAQRNVV